MWEDYMRDLLGWKVHDQTVNKSKLQTNHGDKAKKQINTGEMLNIGDEQFRMRICRADFHGALVKITKSRAASQLGLQVCKYYFKGEPKNETLHARVFGCFVDI